ncbi:MAG: M28 family peptidase, partial [Mucilaginibacter polytrichastri]|nr:M28 family peptidase [Mucilaginibacter polytrichastri]
KVNGVEYTNVIGVYNKGKAKRLIVGAHYDVCGDQPGADDNASAIAGLLESVRLIGEHRPQPAGAGGACLWVSYAYLSKPSRCSLSFCIQTGLAGDRGRGGVAGEGELG